MENKEILDLTKSKYVVPVKRDMNLLKTFVKFSNKVRHPRTTVYMITVGVMLIALPIVNKEIALPGVVICYVMGPLMVLIGLFRHYIGVKMLKDNPNTNLNEEFTYIFANTDVKTDPNGKLEKLGSYAKIYRLWEDEKFFYVGINEDDLVVLPKVNFEAGEADTFKDFIVEKSGCIYTWKPTRIDHVIKQNILNFQLRMTQMRAGKSVKKKSEEV